MNQELKSLITKRLFAPYHRAFYQCTEDLDFKSMNTNMAPSSFINHFQNWIESSKLNKIDGLDCFPHRDVTIGCTQFIDDIHFSYHQNRIRVSEMDYQYHFKINPSVVTLEDGPITPGDLVIITLPFVFYGEIYPKWEELLSDCTKKDVPVFVDAAWFGTCRNLQADLSHPTIRAIGFSLSKGLGLSDFRVGVRFAKNEIRGPLRVHNEHSHLPYASMHAGSIFMQTFSPDFLQEQYRSTQIAICQELDLTPTDCVHLAHGFSDEWREHFQRFNKDWPITIGVAKAIRARAEGKV